MKKVSCQLKQQKELHWSSFACRLGRRVRKIKTNLVLSDFWIKFNTEFIGDVLSLELYYALERHKNSSLVKKSDLAKSDSKL